MLILRYSVFSQYFLFSLFLNFVFIQSYPIYSDIHVLVLNLMYIEWSNDRHLIVFWTGNYFGSYFYMGGERFEMSQPEAYLFGENSDLNFLGSKPMPVCKYHHTAIWQCVVLPKVHTCTYTPLFIRQVYEWMYFRLLTVIIDHKMSSHC